jgi:aspartyl-tRNA(Asn)/glutamyl-tRNA(Gln) amidotransferase subunit B
MIREGWEAVIGLEIHVQLATSSKLFTSAAHRYGDSPNQNVDPVVLGMPGVLPVLNKQAVELAMRVGFALDCQVHQTSRFDRKHYFYADLPKGYQITQQLAPICTGGAVIATVDGMERAFKLNRIHLEEDAGKTIHDSRRGISLVDYNRAGVPLIEVVSEPDMRTSEEAVAFMKALHQVVVATGSSHGDMEKGNFRCDANVSVRPVGQTELGTRTEMKNINSFRFVGHAISSEINRQIDLIEDGGKVVQETRLWDDEAGMSRAMRSKEEAHDYRYFPDPDLMAVEVDDATYERIRTSLPELPRARQKRFEEELSLSSYDAALLTQSCARADYFEGVVSSGIEPKTAANWMAGELLGRLNKEGKDIEESPVSASALADLLRLLQEEKLSGKMGKKAFAAMMDEGVSASDWLKVNGGQITDPTVISDLVERVVANHPEQSEEFRAGKEQLMGFFVGQVMKETRGKANPQAVNAALRAALKGGTS